MYTHSFFGLDGQPITLDEWAALFEDFPARLVAEDTLPRGRLVTVWLGDDDLDRQPPQIFGTALNGCELERYATKDDALAGHARHLARLQTKTTTGGST